MSLQSDLNKLSTMDEVLELEIKGIFYTARWFGVGYWVYRTYGRADDPVYFVTKSKCTCGGFQAMGSCKHHASLKKQFASL